MAIYKKSSGMGGAWVKAEDVVSGTKAKLVSETQPMESQYGTQDVAKIRFEGQDEPLNIRLNKPTINALVDAFGEESKAWVNQVLTAHTEKMMVSGRRVTALYLVPQGYVITEDDAGYLVIEEDDAGYLVIEKEVETPGEELKAEDVPF